MTSRRPQLPRFLYLSSILTQSSKTFMRVAPVPINACFTSTAGVPKSWCGLVEGLHKRFELFLVSEDSWKRCKLSGRCSAAIFGGNPWPTAPRLRTTLLIDWAGEHQLDSCEPPCSGTYA
jgi:hypothetical protein